MQNFQLNPAKILAHDCDAGQNYWREMFSLWEMVEPAFVMASGRRSYELPASSCELVVGKTKMIGIK